MVENTTIFLEAFANEKSDSFSPIVEFGIIVGIGDNVVGGVQTYRPWKCHQPNFPKGF